MSNLLGLSIVAGAVPSRTTATFTGINPATGAALDPPYHAADAALVDQGVNAATRAFPIYRETTGAARARFLRAIASRIEQRLDQLVARIGLETALPETRVRGEGARTCFQLRLFADLVEEGSWVEARIDPALPDRQPQPRPDIRAMLRPLGPVAVFGASNFPLAFSVAGGDTTSALAAGCPVVVKAHPAHPGTSEIVGRAIAEAADETGMPPGVFALLFDAGIGVGEQLVKHPGIKGVGFTGSLQAGRALFQLAAARDEPIPVYAEMGSINPQFCLPAALASRAEAIAGGLTQSFTLGVGQFCTKPGVVFHDGRSELVDHLKRAAADWCGGIMLTPAMAARFAQSIEQRANTPHVRTIVSPTGTSPHSTGAWIVETDMASFLANPALAEEIFGPTTLLVKYESIDQLMQAASTLQGQLTASIHADPDDIPHCQQLLPVIEERVGRVVFNQFPTGVEVGHAMIHGGPYPATTDSRSTSVGTLAIRRFARHTCYQNLPDALLPPELQQSNPLGIRRLVDGRPEQHP